MSLAEFSARFFEKEPEMGSGGVTQRLPVKKARRIAILPTARLGSWSVGLGVASFVLVLAWRLMGPLGALPGFVCGLVAGVVALVAIVRRGERALTVFAAIAPLVLVFVFVLAELIIGHE